METTPKCADSVVSSALSDLAEILSLAVLLGRDRVAEFVRCEIDDELIRIESES